jgi:carboxymethylenebutenolidase
MNALLELTVDNEQFPVYVSRPNGKIRGGLIVIHEVWGLTNHIKSIADRFAAEGYLVISPNLLSVLGITEKLAGELQDELFDPERRAKAQPKLRELMAPMQAPGFAEQTIARVQACYDYLKNQGGIGDRIGVTGFCFGGSYSFSLAVVQPQLKAAIPFYGHADYPVAELKNISCPILAFYGEHDERLMTSLPELKTKMQEAGVNFTAQVYKDCGHAFFNDTNKFTYNELAAKDAWVKTLTFIDSNFA